MLEILNFIPEQISWFVSIIKEMLSYPFMARALGVGLLISLCASLLGVSLILKRYAMIGHGLSNVGFAAVAIATALRWAPFTISIPIVVLAAFVLLQLSQNGKIKGDAAIALLSTSALAIGVMIISLSTGINTDVCNYLFGTVLAITIKDVQISVVLSIIVFITFILFYNRIFAVTFDEVFSKATGTKSGFYNSIISISTALIIVVGMRMMGALLVSSLVVFPALSAMRLFKTFRSVSICSAIISVVCYTIGMIISYLHATPTGASIVMCNIVVFVVFHTIRMMKGAFKKDEKIA